ncbi:glycosyltransferase family 2 protein [Tabrizicola aquatica]|uniref:glycosyltransferase family 2 protein n=1 Tax=Tabrizicola aquatica TaxID=909926 RepID=UPI0011AEE781|nr:glycosyltransferase family 2 protein [Tabrizicola aquatica]
MDFQRRNLSVQRLSVAGGLSVLSALRSVDGLRLFLDLRDSAGQAELEQHFAEVTKLGESAIARPWPGADAGLGLVETPAEPGLFAGLRTALSLWNGESVETVRSWLLWLNGQHGLQAALILDRSPPDEAVAAADQLEAALRDTPDLAGLRLVLVSADVALGDPKLGHEAHPMNLPDAPGKDRMEAPLPDPWRAPIQFHAWYELARWQFLTGARSVLALDPIDLLPAPEAGVPTVFEAAETLRGAYLPLSGQRAYPWTLRPDAPAEFGDHICTRFDAGPDLARWCVAPAKGGAGGLWRWRRITGMRAAPVPRDFYRCVALRTASQADQPQAVSRLVPKSSLVENPVLAAISTQLGAAPRRIPQAALRPIDGPGQDVTIVSTMKNEGPFILEWLAYHRIVGIEKFLIYTNDCTDGTDHFLKLLARKGLIEHRENPYRESGLKPQHAALAAADREALVTGASWVICMDVDEYINVKTGDGTLAALFAAVPDANLISMTWRLFGNGDVQGFDPAPIIGQFDRCAPEMARKPHQAWGFKTMFRNLGLFRKLGVHRPKGLVAALSDRINWVNGSGRAMPESVYRTAWRSSLSTVGYDLVQLNHYAVRSAESFLVKRDRGRVNHVDRDQGLAYWFRMNNNSEVERGIMRMIPALEQEMARLLADPEIRAAHEGCIAAHRAHIARLIETEQYSRFYAEITGERMQRLSRMHRHFGTNVFLAGPEVIPDDIVFKDHPADFFFNVPPVAEAEHD